MEEDCPTSTELDESNSSWLITNTNSFVECFPWGGLSVYMTYHLTKAKVLLLSVAKTEMEKPLFGILSATRNNPSNVFHSIKPCHGKDYGL